jgi:hypothetical protein
VTDIFFKKLKMFNVGEGRYHNTTGTREVSLVAREVGMTWEGEEESAGQGVNVQLKELSINRARYQSIISPTFFILDSTVKFILTGLLCNDLFRRESMHKSPVKINFTVKS